MLIVGDPATGLLAGVAAQLADRGLQVFMTPSLLFDRHVGLVVSRGASGLGERRLRVAGRSLDLSLVRAVWQPRPFWRTGAVSAAPGHRGWLERESDRVLEDLHSLLDCRWIPAPPPIVRQAEGVIHQLECARRAGWQTPRTLITNEPRAFLDFYSACAGRVVSRSPGGREIVRNGERFLTRSRLIGRRDLRRLPALRHGPVVFQEYIAGELEVRVIVVGRQVTGVAQVPRGGPAPRKPWLSGSATVPACRAHRLSPGLQALCLQLISALGLSCGELELVRTEGGEYVLVSVDCLDGDERLGPLIGRRVRRQVVNLVASELSAARPVREAGGGGI